MENLTKLENLTSQLKELYEAESKLLNSSEQVALMFEITCEYLKDGILTPKPYKSFKDYFYFEFFEGEAYESISKHPQKSNIYNKLNCWQFFAKGVNKELASESNWVATKVEEIKKMNIKEILNLIKDKKEEKKEKKEGKKEGKKKGDDVEVTTASNTQVTPEKIELNFDNLSTILTALLNDFERLSTQDKGRLLRTFDDFLFMFNSTFDTSYQNVEVKKKNKKVA